MRFYQTQILIPADRSLALQVPTSMPEGWATVTVQINDSTQSDIQTSSDPDRQVIEWWDEFEEGWGGPE